MASEGAFPLSVLCLQRCFASNGALPPLASHCVPLRVPIPTPPPGDLQPREESRLTFFQFPSSWPNPPISTGHSSLQEKIRICNVPSICFLLLVLFWGLSASQRGETLSQAMLCSPWRSSSGCRVQGQPLFPEETPPALMCSSPVCIFPCSELIAASLVLSNSLWLASRCGFVFLPSAKLHSDVLGGGVFTFLYRYI